MNLILWRHAEAEDGTPDLARELTPHGRKQASRIAHWLTRHLSERYLLISSPAVRTLQTARALCELQHVEPRIEPRIAPGADAGAVLAAIDWPGAAARHDLTVVIVGHQPTLGCVAARLLTGRELYWSVRKGACWWFTVRDGAGEEPADIVLRAVVDPQFEKH